MELSQHIEPFRSYISDQEGLAPGTVKSYLFYLSRFMSLAHVKTTEEINLAAFEKFKSEMLQRGVGKRTINGHLAGLRTFLHYLNLHEIKTIPVEQVKFYSKIKDVPLDLIDRKELMKFLSAKVSPTSDLLANMLFSTGMRIFELAKMNIEEVRECRIPVLGKGGKDRVVFLDVDVCKMLSNFVKPRTLGPVFLNRSGVRMSIRYLQKIIERRASELKVSKHLSVHTLRHHFATDMHENGADIRDIQEFLGHASIVTTQRYTHVSKQHLTNTYAQFHSKVKPVKIRKNAKQR